MMSDKDIKDYHSLINKLEKKKEVRGMKIS